MPSAAILRDRFGYQDLMQAEPGVWVVGPDGELIPDYDSTFPEINEGEVVHGTVVRVDKDEVLVDIGYKSEGVIPVSELSIRRVGQPGRRGLARRRDRCARAHEGRRRRSADPLEEARTVRAGLEEHRARRRVRRAGQRPRDRGRQGRPDHRPGRARLPAGVARRHPPRAGPGRVPGPGAALQSDRAEPLAQQRRALAPRRARRGAQGAADSRSSTGSSPETSSRARSPTSSTSAPSSTSTAWTA